MAAFDDYLARFGPTPYTGLLTPPPAPPPPRGMVAPEPSGPTGWRGYAAAPVAGVFEAGGMLGSAAQAAAKAVGADSFAKTAGEFAQRQRETAATYENPDIAKMSWYDPRNIAYQVLKGAPTAAAGAGAALGAAAAAPEGLAGLAGLGAASAIGYPLAVGGNAQTSEAYRGPLSQGEAVRSLAYGVPEAIVGALPFKGLGNMFARGVEGSVLHTATHQAASQAAAAAGQDLIAQQMGDPNRTVFDRMQSMAQAAVTGGITGAALGAGVHALAKAPPAKVSDEDLSRTVDAALAPPAEPARPPVQEPIPEREAVIPQPDVEQTGIVNESPIEHAPSLGDMEVPNVVYPDSEPPPPPEDIKRAPPPGPEREAVIPQPDLEQPGVVNEPLIEHTPSFGDTEIPDVGEMGNGFGETPEAHPLAAAGPDAIKRAVRSAAGTVPRWLDPSNYEAAVKSWRAEVGERGEDAPPLRAAVRKAGEALGLVDENGEPIAQPEPPKPETTPVDAFPKQQQALKRQADKLAAKAIDEPVLAQKLNDAEAAMAAGGKGSVAKAKAQIAEVKKAVEAKETLAKARGEEQSEIVGNDQKLISDSEPAPPPAAKSMVETLLAKKPKVVEPPKGATPLEAPATRAAAQAAQASLDQLKNAPLPFPEPKNKREQDINKTWTDGLAAQQAKLDAVTGAADKGDRRALQRPGEYDFANDKLYFKPGMPKALQAALDAHAELEGRVLDAREKEFPPGDVFARPAGTADTGPRSPVDVGITGLVNAGGEGKDVLGFIAAHGTPEQRVTAAKLLRNGINPTIRFSTPDEALAGTNFRPGDRLAGLYRAADDQIHLYGSSDLATTALHEAVHSASAKALEAGGRAAKEFTDLYDQVMDRLDPSENARQTPHEFMAEAYTNPEFRDWLRSQKAEGVSLWQKFKDGVARLLGFDGGAKTLLDQVIERGDQVFRENQAAAGATGDYASPATPQGQNERAKAYVAAADGAKDYISEKLFRLGRAGARVARGFADPSAIAKSISHLAPSAEKFIHAQHDEANQKNAWNKLRALVDHAYRTLPDAEREAHDYAAAATVYGADPRKPWDQQSPELRQAGNADDIKYIADQAYRRFSALSPAGKAAFEARVAANQTARLAPFTMSLDQTMKALVPGLKGFDTDPGTLYQMAAEAHDSPELSRKFWLDQMAPRVAGLKEAANAAWMKLGVTPEQYAQLKEVAEARRPPDPAAAAAAKKALKALDPKTLEQVEMMQRWIDGADRQIKALDDVPYFRVGRGRGDFFASSALKLDDKGFVDPKAVDRVKERLAQAGFGNVVIERANGNNAIYVKADTRPKADRLRSMFEDLQKEGWLDAEKPIASGAVEDAAKHNVGPAVLQDVMKAMSDARPTLPEGVSEEEAAKFNDAWDRSLTAMHRELMDILADSSPLKINAKRRDFQGFAKEMGKSAREQDAAISAFLGRMGAAPSKGAAIAGIRDELRAVNRMTLPGGEGDKLKLNDAVTELMMREAHRPVIPPNDLVTALTWVNRASVIGFNPAYWVTLHTQDWTYSIPELGKSHGMLNAAREIARAEIPSIKVMRAMLKDPDWAFAGMRRKSLIEGGVSPRDADYLVALDNMGAMTHGALTQSQVSVDGNNLQSRAANWSTAMGRYAEVQPRIKMALAARALWRGVEKDGPLLDFAAKKINGSQFDYSTENTPRELTRMGTAGNLSPLINQFMSYRAKATAKLYTEIHDLFKGETKQQKLEAGKFLAGHLAATVMISGAMGLPLTAVLASVYDKVADTLTGSPNHDILASFRHYLEHVYGKGVGTAIARGVPTALGIDLSRDGDQKILPGSDAIIALTEKRKFEDAEKDFLQNFAGSAVGMVGRAVLGLRDIANGDYLNGAVRLAPDVFRAPAAATRDMLYGYRDKGGFPVGITPSGVDIALTAMGLEPTAKATLDENKKVLAGLEDRRRYQAQNITQHLAKALNLGHPGDFQYWTGQSNRFMQDWPGIAPPIASLPRYMAAHRQKAAIAAGLGSGGMPAPVGISPKNLTERQFFD